MKRNEHTTVILVHSNELHSISPNPRWNPLNKRTKHTYTAKVLEPYKKLDTLAEKHYSSTHTLQETLSRRVYNHTLQEIEVWNEYNW